MFLLAAIMFGVLTEEVPERFAPSIFACRPEHNHAFWHPDIFAVGERSFGLYPTASLPIAQSSLRCAESQTEPGTFLSPVPSPDRSNLSRNRRSDRVCV